MLKKVTKEDITEHIKIMDIAKEFSIGIEKVSSGNFDHRCTCPSANHKNGQERNKSCYIDSKNNNFYCFACSAGINCIDFYILCSGKPFVDAINILKPRVNSNLVSEESAEKIDANNFPILLETSNILRKAIQTNPEDLIFFNKLMKQMDEQLLNVSSDDTELPEKIHNKVKQILIKKYGELK
jgi:DNA primase